jgi:hypothetical protein
MTWQRQLQCWGVSGSALRSAAVRSTLGPQIVKVLRLQSWMKNLHLIVGQWLWRGIPSLCQTNGAGAAQRRRLPPPATASGCR